MWRKTLTYSAVIFSGTVVCRAFIFFHRLLLIRTMAVDDFAVFALLLNLFIWLLVFANFSLSTAVSRSVSKLVARLEYPAIKTVYFRAFVLSLFFSLASVCSGFILARGYGAGTFNTVFFFSGLIPMALSTLNDGFLKGFEKFCWASALNALMGISRFVLLALYMAWMGNCIDLGNVMVLLSAACHIPFIISSFFVWKLISSFQKGNKDSHPESFLDLLRYSRWITVTDLLNSGIVLTATWFISIHSLTETAVFNVVITLYSIFQMGFSAITTALIPQISLNAAKGMKINMPGRKPFWLIGVFSLTLAGVMVFSPSQKTLLNFLFHNDVYSEAIVLLSILVIGFPFRLNTMWSKGVVQGLGDSRSIATIALAVFLTNVFLMLFLYNRFHLYGILASIVICQIIENTLSRKRAKNIIKQRTMITKSSPDS